MNKKKCLGLLGYAGNYGEIKRRDLVEALNFALSHYDVIDVSDGYGMKFNVLDCLQEITKKEHQCEIIYKFGVNYNDGYDVSDSSKKTLNFVHQLGCDKINSILSHRPSINKLNCDILHFANIKSQYPDIAVGICTNSQHLYEEYSRNIPIDVVQLAINPFDYLTVSSFIAKLENDRVQIQGRSILSNGLLSGKYDEFSKFEDVLRSRYNEGHMREHFLSKMQIAKKIYKFLQEEFECDMSEVSTYLYSIFEVLIDPHLVIRGGSSLEQIKRNLDTRSIQETLLIKFRQKMLHEWSVPYV